MQRKHPDLIIEGGTVITMVDDQEPILNASVFVADGRIVGIEKPTETTHTLDSTAEIIDAREAVIMPGLINAHSHTAMTLLRGFADDLPLKKWLFEEIFPAEMRLLNPETVYWASLLGCIEMIASGTTCFADGYFFQDATVRAVQESGLRAIIAQGVIDFPAPGVEDPKENLKVARQFIEKWHGISDLIIPGIFCHSPVTCSDTTLKASWEISQAFNLPLQIHLSESMEEVNEVLKKTGKRPVHYLDQLGIIGADLIVAHAIYLDDKEMSCLREKGAKIVHVPESNMKLATGVAEITKMVNMGLTVGLGTDGCASNNNLDLFSEMDTAAKLSKVSNLDPIGLDAKTVLRMATTWGSSVLGLKKEVGTLEEGKKADIIVVDLHSPHMCPLYNPISSLVYSGSGADVKDVVVNGKVLMKDKKFTMLDPAEVMEKVRSAAAL